MPKREEKKANGKKKIFPKFNQGKDVDNAKKALEEKAFQTKKEFLQNINNTINQTVGQLNDLAKNIGAIFHTPPPKKGEEEVPTFRWGNEYPVIAGGFGITINGRELGVDRLAFVTDMEINQEVGTDTCSFTVVDPNMYFIEDDIYKRDTQIQTSITLLGVPTSNNFTKVYFDGYISNIDIDFTNTGAPTLTISCVDKATHEMGRKRWRRSWENVTSSQVVQIIAQEMGFQVYVEPEYPFPVQASIIQDDKTNIEFIEELAGKELELFVANFITNDDGKTILYYVIKGHINEENYQTLGYSVSNSTEKDIKQQDVTQYDVISFRPQINIEQRQEEVSGGGINSDDKSVEQSSVDVPDHGDGTNGGGSDSSSGGDDEADENLPI